MNQERHWVRPDEWRGPVLQSCEMVEFTATIRPYRKGAGEEDPGLFRPRGPMIRITAEIEGQDASFQDIARQFEDILHRRNKKSKAPHEYTFRAEIVSESVVVGDC